MLFLDHVFPRSCGFPENLSSGVLLLNLWLFGGEFRVHILIGFKIIKAGLQGKKAV